MNVNTREINAYSNIAATTAEFKLRGGCYGVQVNATWGGGNVALQRKSPDGSTWVPVVTAFTANGYASANLLNGSYRFAVTTATAVYAECNAIVSSTG